MHKASFFFIGIMLALPMARAAVGADAIAKNILAAAPTPEKNLAPLNARPKITGEYIVESDLKTVGGQTLSLSTVLQGKYSVVVFSKPENIWFEAALGYFRKLVPYLTQMDYQVVVVTPEAYDYIKDIALAVETHGHVLIDADRKSFVGMGLMDQPASGKPAKDAPAINAIYLVAPDRQIMFQYASVSDKIPFSGEVLVLAARVYRDAFRAREKAK